MAEFPSKSAFVVLGMHRSGTSMLARLVSAPGPEQPRDLLALQPDNPLGFSESARIVRLNDRILNELGSAWDQPFQFVVPGKGIEASRPEIMRFVRDRFIKEAVFAVRHAYEGCRSIVVKDPRICLLPDLWEEALAQSGFATRRMLIYRNPLEVAASLRVRNGIRPAAAHHLWLRYTLAALTFFSHAARSAQLANYDAFLRRDSAAGSAPLFDLPSTLQPLEHESSPDDLIRQDARHHRVSARQLAASPTTPSIVKETYQLLEHWSSHAPAERERLVANLVSTVDDQARYAGALVSVHITPSGLNLMPEQSATNISTSKRFILLHYHLFKNAGTSVDSILKRNFGEGWENVEFPPPSTCDHAEAIRDFVLSNPDLTAISSHTLLAPPPILPGVELFPIIFLRNPLDRLRSAYEFERRQVADTQGAHLAKENDFAGYIATRLRMRGDRSFRNFQTYRLAALAPPAEGDEHQRALSAIAALPFIGLVESFSASIALLETKILARLPGFKGHTARENTAPDSEGSGRLNRPGLQDQIGKALFDEVLEANQRDLEIYELVRSRFQAMTSSASLV